MKKILLAIDFTPILAPIIRGIKCSTLATNWTNWFNGNNLLR